MKLSPEGRKKARLSVLRKQDTPEDVVKAWTFFREWYLRPSGFYRGFLKSPRFHYKWIYLCAKYTRNILAAPRGSGKSIVVGTEWPIFLALTNPGADILVCTLEKKKAKKRGQRWMRILSSPRIVEDFGDLKGNYRNEGRMWGFGLMQLSNGSVLQTTSIGSYNLGERPLRIIWDDIDPDPQLYKGSIEQVTEDAVTALFDVFLPMLDVKECGFDIIGTLNHRRSFLYWLFTTRDQRLRNWVRDVTAIVDKKGRPTWPEKWNSKRIQQLKNELGAAFYAAYMNEPRSSEDCLFDFHAKRCKFDVVEDDVLVENPFESSAVIIDYTADNLHASEFSDEWRERKRKASEVFKRMAFFLLADYAEGQDSFHDYSAYTVIGIDEDDVWWVVDCWAGRTTPEKLAELIWQAAAKWRVKMIAVEAIGPYQALARRIMDTREEAEHRYGWVPSVRRVTYPAHLSKATRIAGLQWRFEKGRIKVWRRNDGPWGMLNRQIEGFTMNLQNLQHDDLIDSVAILPQILSRGFTGVEADSEGKERDPHILIARRLIEGDTHEVGVPIITGLNPSDIPVNDMRAARVAEMDEDKDSAPVPAAGLFSAWDLAKEIDRWRRENE